MRMATPKKIGQNTLAYRYELLIRSNEGDISDIIKVFESVAKKWCLQEENDFRNELYYRCRVSLKEKQREVIFSQLFPGMVLITSRLHGRNFYAMSENNNVVGGPWSNMKPYTKIEAFSRQERKWHPWQQQIIDSIKTKQWKNMINIVIDAPSLADIDHLVMYLIYRKMVTRIYSLMDEEDINYAIDDIATPATFIIQSPVFSRTMSVQELLFIRSVQYRSFKPSKPSPQIWVFVNNTTALNALDPTVWKTWTIEGASEGHYLRQLN